MIWVVITIAQLMNVLFLIIMTNDRYTKHKR